MKSTVVKGIFELMVAFQEVQSLTRLNNDKFLFFPPFIYYPKTLLQSPLFSIFLFIVGWKTLMVIVILIGESRVMPYKDRPIKCKQEV